MRRLLGGLGCAAGKGLLAGVAGTAAMTVSSTVEARLRERPPSDAPARAAARALGIRAFEGDDARARFNDLSHWAYGTGWGAARGLLGATGMPGGRATLLHLGAVWGAGQVMLPALEIAPPATEWGAEEVAIDLLHHAVYAIAAGAAYRLIDL